MAAVQTGQAAPSRCTLCPAACGLLLAAAGPDAWRAEYPPDDAGGLCPRGSAICELLSSHRRIKDARKPVGGVLSTIGLSEAIGEIISRASGKGVTVFLDGNVPGEQLDSAVAACGAWGDAKLCIVVEPADEQMLTGVEASGADYLPGAKLAECDGFVIIGDAFSANPMCTRGVLDRRSNQPRTPIVVIDPAAGTASKFATHNVAVAAGMELAALAAVVAAAGVEKLPKGVKAADGMPSAEAAGGAIAGCSCLGVLIAAEYGRPVPWRQIGQVAGALAKAKGGGVAAQTVGANALAAVRTAAKAETASLAEALSDDAALRVAIGCDLVGMLGRNDLNIFAAAAAVANETAAAAEIVLPLALNEELGGTVMQDCDQPTRAAALMPPPAGVPSPAELIAALAFQAGARQTAAAKGFKLPPRVKAGAAAPKATWTDPSAPIVLAGRQAANSGCGAVTGQASWQIAFNDAPQVRVSADLAEAHNIANLALVSLSIGGATLSCRVRIAPELGAGVVVLPEGLPQVRRLMPSKIDKAASTVTSAPAPVPAGLFGG